MKQILLIFVFVVLSGCATHFDERLLGSWKSDREGTVAEYDRRFPDRFEGETEKKEKFANTFGNIIHTFTLDSLAVENEDGVFTVQYKVINNGNDFVIIKTYGIYSDKIKIRFSDNFNSYWVNDDTNYPEKFTKVDTDGDRE